jgi:LuxR family maltose regulon positive regulatory protein
LGSDTHTAELPTLLRTKLHRPPITADLVPRPRLLERLEGHRERLLTLVSAPAGYGKTTLVSSWLEACDCPSAWVSLDEDDNDLFLFLTYFLAAIQSMFPEACRETVAMLKAPTLPPTPVLARGLVSELDEIESPFILALDDYHLIRETAVHDLLGELLRHPPQSLHPVLTSRTDPPLNLTRLRARNQVTEIRTPELRFSQAETAAFLEEGLGAPVDTVALKALTKQVEGWAAGLRLISLSLRHRGSLDLSPARLGGDVAYVTDYLMAEVLDSQPPAIQDFLLKTSVLDRLNGPLCDAVCSGETKAPSSSSGSAGAGLDEPECNGQTYLEWLHQTGLFTIPLDDQREWYRYHHLFRQLLRGQSERKLGADGIAALHSRASAWFAQHGLIDEALHHALAAGDTDTATGLVARHRHQAMNQEQWHRLRRWLRLLPREVVENDPQLLIIEAWLLIGWTEMAHVAERVGALLKNLPPESTDTSNLQAEFDTLQSLISYHITDGQQSLALAQRALENLPREFASERGLAVMLESLAYQMLGDLESARSVVWQALTRRAAHHPTYHARVLMTLCFLDSIAADLYGAMQSAEQVLKLGQELNLAESIAHGYYFLGHCHYERNELATAEKCLLPVVKGAYIANLHNFTFSSFALALTYQAQGQPAEAREVVETVVGRAIEMGDVSLLQTAQAFQAELAIRQGNVAAAHLWAKTFSPEPFYVAYRFYVPQTTLPKVLLALDTPDSRGQASDFLSRLRDFFTSIHNYRLLIEVLALQALLHDAQNNEPAVLSTLERAIALAEPGRFIRLFVDLGPKMARLLDRLRRQGVATEYIAQILAAFRGETKDEGRTTNAPALNSSFVAGPSSLVEPLTDRELDVLALLAQRLSNKEIAAQLVISPLTVKKHTVSIYGKLGVKNRRQAVSRSAELGILPER